MWAVLDAGPAFNAEVWMGHDNLFVLGRQNPMRADRKARATARASVRINCDRRDVVDVAKTTHPMRPTVSAKTNATLWMGTALRISHSTPEGEV